MYLNIIIKPLELDLAKILLDLFITYCFVRDSTIITHCFVCDEYVH